MKITLIKLALFAGLFSLAACKDEDDPQPEPQPQQPVVDSIDIPVYKTSHIMSFAGPGQIQGIAYDGDHFWMTLHESVGDYNDPDTIRVIKYDHQTGTTLKTFVYIDPVIPMGLAFVDNSLWIKITNLEKIDTASGAILQTWGSNNSVSDIDFDSTYLVTSDAWGNIRRIHPQNGSIGTPITASFTNSSKGVACRPGEVWLSSRSPQKLVVYTSAGSIKGYVQFDPPPCSACTTAGDFTCFTGTDTLAYVRDNQVHIVKVLPY